MNFKITGYVFLISGIYTDNILVIQDSFMKRVNYCATMVMTGFPR